MPQGRDKSKIITRIVLIAVGVLIVVFAKSTLDFMRELACNMECRAQLLVKNSVFYEVRGFLTKAKTSPSKKFSFDYVGFTKKSLA